MEQNTCVRLYVLHNAWFEEAVESTVYGAYICIDKKVLQEFFHRFLRLGSPGLKRDYFS